MESKWDVFKQGFATRLGFLTKEERKEIDDIKRGRGESDWGAFKRGFREYIFGDIRDDMPNGASPYDISGIDGMDGGDVDWSPIMQAVDAIERTTESLYKTAQKGLATSKAAADKANIEQDKKDIQEIYKPQVTKKSRFETLKTEEVIDQQPPQKVPATKTKTPKGKKPPKPASKGQMTKPSRRVEIKPSAPKPKGGLSIDLGTAAVGTAAVGAATTGLWLAGKETREESRTISTPATKKEYSYDAEITKEIPPEGRALLDAISVPESGGRYDIIVGAGKGGYSLKDSDKEHNEKLGYDRETPPESFSDYSKHPNVRGLRTKYGFSTAAGRYQITKSTWDRLSSKYGLTSFSPQNQDRAAWFLAQEDYERNTGGRSLIKDLTAENADIMGIAKALSTTWTSLSGGVEEQAEHGSSKFEGNYTKALAKRSAELEIAKADEARTSMIVAIDNSTNVTTVKGSTKKEELNTESNSPKSIFDYFR